DMFFTAAPDVHGHYPVEEGLAGAPFETGRLGQGVDLTQSQRGEGAGETRGCPRGESQLERIGQVVPAPQGGAAPERYREPVLALFNQGRAMEMERHEEAMKVRRGHQQVDR